MNTKYNDDDDKKAAQAHMYNGCKMLAELQRNTTGRSLTSIEVESMLRSELQNALHFVASQVNGPSQSLLQISPICTPGGTPDGTPGGTPGEDKLDVWILQS